METQEKAAGSNLAEKISEQPELQKSDGAGAQAANLSGASFSTYYTWRANGVFHAVPFANASIHPNSRVFVNISEFSTDAQHRFIGSARMAVYNIAPFEGGFYAWVEISWSSPLNIRFDVLVDP
ncbi:hypothetical protein [Janthinobacterium agaricidamnosum]|uniref:Uncharacterized protein n=1 Tax=Janthinobacterium agaricidamnosum NBRC 102515 = DSM 9628 TaxID=1349767 RepID=W0V9V3_9BURK|nr:hypothetical protein [Janthinobacterium agaricidamnosum]CDG84037.1 hypothetical protein GJA_3418 [Janthinobacterium agaricidamnosum NBRC 102515 = DSM 9628]